MEAAVGGVGGQWEPRFDAVRALFAEILSREGELGASLAVTVDGRRVIDLWGGYTDKAHTSPWARDTLVNVFSVSKGAAATATLLLVDEGRLDLDAPVARVWPEFAAAGKEAVTTRQILSHTAGLPALAIPTAPEVRTPALDRASSRPGDPRASELRARRPRAGEDVPAGLPPEALFEPERLARMLAAARPAWPPGSAHGYHSMTIGWLLGEIVRRVSGRTIGAFFRERIAIPHDIDFHFGLPAPEAHRVAEVRGARPAAPGEPDALGELLGSGDPLAIAAFTRPQPITAALVNSPEFRAAEIPAVNGHGTARGLADLYGLLATGRLLAPATIEAARRPAATGRDRILGRTTSFGLGFMLDHPDAPLAGRPGTFGHPGAGGSLGFADPEARLSFGFTLSRLGRHMLVDARARALIDAVYAAL